SVNLLTDRRLSVSCSQKTAFFSGTCVPELKNSCLGSPKYPRVFSPLPVAVKILLFLLERVFKLAREQSICSLAPESSRKSTSPPTDPATTEKILVGEGEGPSPSLRPSPGQERIERRKERKESLWK